MIIVPKYVTHHIRVRVRVTSTIQLVAVGYGTRVHYQSTGNNEMVLCGIIRAAGLAIRGDLPIAYSIL